MDFALETAEAAGKILLGEFRGHAPGLRASDKEAKSIGDRLADEVITHAVAKHYPEHAYLTEETGWVRRGESDFLWIVDPLDGTGNFENHNPFFAVSIALWYQSEPLLGVVEAPALGERFWAVVGRGASRRDLWRGTESPLAVSFISERPSSYWVFCQGGEKRRERTQAVFDQAFPQVKEFRKIGSAALELAWVAAGRAEGYATTSIYLWDIAAGMVILGEAGGIVRRFDGSTYGNEDSLSAETFDLQATNGRVALELTA